VGFGVDDRTPGARAFYDSRRAAGDGHRQALRALANRLVGILDGSLTHHTAYDENIALGTPPRKQTRYRRFTFRTVGCLDAG